jgi:hypothetical protein
MIVVVETNFIVELVVQQEQSRACEAIVALCSSTENARLVTPAFAIAEAGMVLERRKGERRRIIQVDLPRHAHDMGRAKPLRRVEEMIGELSDELAQAEIEEASRWLEFRSQLGTEVEVIALTQSILDEALAVQLGSEVEQFPDALVLASVTSFLSGIREADVHVPAYFVSRDDDAFQSKVILDRLKKLRCTYINSFENTLKRLQHSRESS